MKKETIVSIIKYAFVILFVYTALSKWFLYPIYLSDLQRSPYIGHFALIISILIPAAELIVAAVLLFGNVTRGLYGALVLMVMFTIYVAVILLFSSSRPCTCGGIIRDLTWQQHMVFNLVFTGLAMLGIKLGGNPHATQQFYKTE